MSTYNAAEWLLDRRLAAGDGERVALRCEGESVSYGELLRQVWRVQNALRELGIREGERVALVANDEPALVAWFLGAMRSGVVPVPLSTMLTASELVPIVTDAQAAAVVVSEAAQSCLTAVTANAASVRARVVLGRDTAGDARDWSTFADVSEARVAATDADTSAFWLYSSGTTGVPKGVMHRHGSPEATATTYARSVLGITRDDRCLSVAKLFFAYGLGNSLTFPFSVGATAILDPGRPTPDGMAALLTGERPTLFFASPGFVASLLDAQVPAESFESVRLAVTAGEALPADLHRRFRSHIGRPVLDGIGTTEALHIFISNRAGDERPGTSGTPVDGYEVRLLDEHDAEVVAADTPGRLHVRGPSIASGYWQRPDATAQSFANGWLRTGDVYTRGADGAYTFLGRNNDMIKAGGMWVSPAEVEGVLVEHPDVLEAAVVGDRNVDGLETTVAFLVAKTGRVIDDSSIERHCRDRIAAFKRPRQVIVVPELPKTATGKIRRFALREQLAATRA